MYNNSKVAKAIRLAMMFGAAATASVSTSAFSAEEAVEEEVERIEVTGSRIKRADMESASPVSIITSEDMKIQGIANVADALQNLTAQSGGLTAAVNNGGSGNATVDLRGLGASRTLVLVNGRRMVASGTGATSTVDLNTIPMSAVKRIEVLKDGASAVYGSDAVAGVVNIIMRDDFEGLEFDVQYGESSEGDGEETTLSTTFGISSDKGNIVVNLGYYDRGEVRQSARDYSNCPIWETDDGDGPYKYCGGSSFSLGMNAFTDIGRVQFEPGGNNSSNADGLHDWVNSGDNNDRYNYSALSYLSTPAERYNASVIGKYELAEDLTFFSEVFYTNRTSTQQMAPQPVYYAYDDGNRNWYLDQNPGIYPYSGLYPFADNSVDADGNPVSNVMYPLRRMQEVGPRIFEQNVDTIQMTTGLDGMIGDYYWNVFYTYGRNSSIDVSRNYISMGRMIDSATNNCEGVTVDGTWDNYTVSGNDPANPCINYFGLGSLSAAEADYIRYTDQNSSGTELFNMGATISGDLLELPAGVAGFAFGLERRKESAFNQPDAFTSSGIGAGNAVQPTKGQYTVNEAYLELVLPLLADLPMAKQVDLEAAVRAFDYDSFGSDSTYKLGLTWKMNDMIMVRSVLSTAFRAPNVSNLFGGQSDSYTNFSDPCEGIGGAGADPQYAVACANDVNNGLIPGDGTWEQGNGQVRAVVGGNTNLGPETADTFTVGLVIEPIEGLSLTVDYYDLQIDKVISSLGVADRLDKCYSAGSAGGVGGSNVFCTSVARGAVGDFDGISATAENLAIWNVKGTDFDAQYNFEAAGLDWRLAWSASYIERWSSVSFVGEEAVDNVGVALSSSGSIPELKQNFNAQVKGDDWTIAYNVLWVDSLTTESVALYDADPAENADNIAESFASHTLSATYFLNDNIVIRAGIDNLLDEQPPYYTDYDDSNTDTTLYQYIGRNFYLGATMKF